MIRTPPADAGATAPDEAPWTILRVLDWTRTFFQKRGVDNPRLDAEVILTHTLGIPRVMLYARFDQPLAEGGRCLVGQLAFSDVNG